MRPSFLLTILFTLAASSCGQNPHLTETDPVSAAALAPPTVASAGDADGDGVIDPMDQCRDIPGPASNQGCPVENLVPELDSDQDGLVDSKDDCVNLAGPVENGGCPFNRETEKKILLAAMTSLKFDFDTARIKKISFPALDDLVDFLKTYPMTTLKMVGHTDDQGSDAYNLRLARARVMAVKNFMIESGINENRILLDSRGERDPLVSIAGKSGEILEAARAQNRRVDMSVRYVGVESAR